MDAFLDLAIRFSGLAGPLDDVSHLIFYREVHSLLRDALDDYGARLFERMMAWAGAVALSVLTLWLTIQGYRIVTGQSRESLIALVTGSMKAVLIIGVATGMALGGSTLFDFVSTDLSNQVNRLVAGQTGDLYESIDRTLGFMQLAFGSIDALHTGDDPHLQDISDRNMLFTGIGMGGPAIVAGGLLLVYKAMMALLVGFAPLCVLCLLFKQSAPIFRNWLDYLLGTLFALSVLGVVTSLAMDLICAVAASFWAGKLLGANPEGITSLAMQQGGLGLILTALIISVPPAAARFFRGLLAEFMPFSAFGGQGASRSATQAAYAGPSHTYTPERDHTPIPTHAHRVSAPVQAQADEVKPVADTRSFLERYPNATASLEKMAGSGDPASADLYVPAAGGEGSNTRHYTASDIDFVVTERTPTPSGGYLERPHLLERGSAEYEVALRKFGQSNLKEIAYAANMLGGMLVDRGNKEEIDTFNGMRSIAIELNPDLAHRASYSAKAKDGIIYINPDIYLDYDAKRQAKRMAHEFRHFMPENIEKANRDYAGYSSEAEEDARDFATSLFGKDAE